MSARLSKIDELTRPDHTFLQPEDECFYLGDYTARKGFQFSPINKLIYNLKKPMDRRGKPEWNFKETAIRDAKGMLREAINQEWLSAATLVPMPPSKTRDHPEYNDRLLRILQRLGEGLTLDVRELVVMTRSVEPAHLSDAHRDVQEFIASMSLDEQLTAPEPQVIGVFDDLLTTGAHTKAVQEIIRRRLPGVPIVGIFVARRAPEALMF